jgi:hypothetical protein
MDPAIVRPVLQVLGRVIIQYCRDPGKYQSDSSYNSLIAAITV